MPRRTHAAPKLDPSTLALAVEPRSDGDEAQAKLENEANELIRKSYKRKRGRKLRTLRRKVRVSLDEDSEEEEEEHKDSKDDEDEDDPDFVPRKTRSSQASLIAMRRRMEQLQNYYLLILQETNDQRANRAETRLKKRESSPIEENKTHSSKKRVKFDLPSDDSTDDDTDDDDND